MSNQRLTYLFARYVQGQCDAAEKRELSALALALQNESDLQQLLEQYWSEVKGEMVLPEERTKEILVSILHGEVPVVKMKPVIRRIKWLSVAAVLLLVVVGWWFLVRGLGDKSGVGSPETEVMADVSAPVINKATIKLADGRIVYLDSASNGELINMNGVQVVKTEDGKIVYEVSPLTPDDSRLTFNTLTNPRGSKVINLTLSDGTRVWLNAGSSLRYPASFAASRLSRNVEISGEAYFEVAPDKTKPFYVSKGDMEVMVLGTHFNVNAYDDESDIRVTLLEGKVSVSGAPSRPGVLAVKPLVLAPGQQALLTSHDSRLTLNANPNLEETLAWKNGTFQFNNTSIEDIMRQVARWYDVEVVYEGDAKNLHFSGGISRDVEASKLFRMLETTEVVQFRIVGRNVFVIR